MIDGGVANNLPVSVAREMGADIVIAVDITDPLMDKEDLRGAFTVIEQLTTLLTRRISVAGDNRLASDFIRSRLRQKVGKPLDSDQLEQDLKRIYGLGYYETVSYSLEPLSEGGAGLLVQALRKSWGPNYLAFGLNYEDNFEHDSLDDAFLPESGAFAGIRGRLERPDLGSDRDFDSIRAMALGAKTWNKTTVTGLAFANAVTGGVAGIENSVILGGFQRLSAFSRGEVAGEDAALVSVFARHSFGGPFVPWFAGIGAEAGNAWSSLGDARWQNLLYSGSLFAGVETVIGPVQLSMAYNNEADWNAYLNVGFAFTRLFD